VLPSPPARVADIGCGTGSLSILLARAGHDCTASTSPPTCARATESHSRERHATFTEGDAAAPPLRPGRFDIVLARHVL
jgi:2-polyprenyl-3-methyl-5-hydroxy-6-metoxy-1,4-benzoquinol methylase